MSSLLNCGNAGGDDRLNSTDWASLHTRPDKAGTDSTEGILAIPVPILGHLASLSAHIAIQGLFHGVGSDITVRAFNREYRLHRLILMQAKFFEYLMQGPWQEQRTSAVLMQFDDDHITQEGFEVAVGRLYGIWTVEDEGPYLNHPVRHLKDDNSMNFQLSLGPQNIKSARLTKKNVLAVLAAAAYLGIEALCDQCSKFAIRTLSTDRIIEYVQFGDMNCYNPWSTRIADACHSFLCRNGFEDPKMKCLQVFERLPEEWLTRVVGSDAFWVPSEWDRYTFCRGVVHRRRRIWRLQLQEQKQHQDGTSEVADSLPPFSSTPTFDQEDGRNIGVSPRSSFSWDINASKEYAPSETVYRRLFSRCIVYVHMSFEQLQAIMKDSDPLTGHPFTPSEIIHEALWQQTELRTLIETSGTTDSLLSNIVSNWPQIPDSRQRRYDPIPVQDGTYDGDQLLAPGDPRSTEPYESPSTEREVQQPTSSAENSMRTDAETPLSAQPRSRFAPFRFSVSFHDIRLLEANVRISSREFFYAGSLWNVYIQKIDNGQSGPQLGVHLHRHSKSSIPSPKTRMTAIFPTSVQPDYDGNRSPESEDLPSLDGILSMPTTLEQSFSNYVDKREKTSTWFKIFATPGEPDHLIRQFQSSPGEFSVLQSWD
ncbi:hypothetical protein EMPS_00012 [Entomortierella parvispora]|uniref:BTB domain-containing protein n=1 Tax=Entomortierella parvispora TaxID=205924 RepID=A0A9P3GYM3_9FUNG|nr:hypothetical protein EMPS_00012 [Entomortierella parvispora]